MWTSRYSWCFFYLLSADASNFHFDIVPTTTVFNEVHCSPNDSFAKTLSTAKPNELIDMSQNSYSTCSICCMHDNRFQSIISSIFIFSMVHSFCFLQNCSVVLLWLAVILIFLSLSSCLEQVLVGSCPLWQRPHIDPFSRFYSKFSVFSWSFSVIT